jgi:hypothetical protein
LLAGLGAALACLLALAGWAWHRRVGRPSPPVFSAGPEAEAGSVEARARELDRALRSALARHVADAASVTPQELLARSPGPAVASAAILLEALERARFDPGASLPDVAAVQRALDTLRR